MHKSILVSVIIPCRNEEKYIESCIKSLLLQDNLNNKIEIIVVDGMSEDNSKNKILALAKENDCIQLIENKFRTTPHALNLGITSASGEFVAILGAHAEYAPDYLSSCLSMLGEHPEVACVGGPIITKGNSAFSEAAALAMSSFIGVGNAKHRFPKYEGYAEMACFPVFRIDVFRNYGLYDESLIKNQDDEFCFRIRQGGEKVYISPKAKSSYYARENPISLFKQYYQYGFWRVAVLAKHKIPISYRQQIPIFFYTTILVLAILGFIQSNLLLAMILPITYLLTIFIFSLPILFLKNFRVFLLHQIAIIILHLSYALGFFMGIQRFIFIKKFKE
jgi:glycosyltransferase involved in cell wall biosynthesis